MCFAHRIKVQTTKTCPTADQMQSSERDRSSAACAAVAAPPAATGIRRECWNEHENGCWCAGLRLAISRCTRCRRTTPARQKHCTSALLTAQVHATAKAPHRRQTVGVDLDGIAEYRYGFHVALFTNF